MKAWQLSAYNSNIPAAIDSLKLVDLPVPSSVGEGNILLKVQYASINPIDWKLFSGGYHGIGFPIANFPYTPGFDAAGVVEQVGTGVTDFAVGDQLLVDTGLAESCTDPAPEGGPAGTFAEYAVVPASLCVKYEGDLQPVAGLPLAGLTSYQALFTGKGGKSFAGEPLGDAKEGQKVLILGGAGGTGSLAIQMAKAVGCHVTTTSTKVDHCKSLGADEVINYREAEWSEVLAGKDFDLIYDCVGNTEDLSKAAKVLKKGSTFVSIANFDPASKSSDDVRFANFILKSNKEDLQALVDMVKTGKVQVPVETIYDLTQVPEALKASHGGRSSGKLVIKM